MTSYVAGVRLATSSAEETMIATTEEAMIAMAECSHWWPIPPGDRPLPRAGVLARLASRTRP